MEWGHLNADEVAPFQMKSWSPSERFFVKSDWSIQYLFYHSTSYGDEPRFIMTNWLNSLKIKSKESGNFFIVFWAIFLCFSYCSFLLSHRYQSSGSGCRPQACTEGAWRGHSSVAQPGCDESHNYSGHMDGKCSLSFYTQSTTIFHCYTLSK